MIEKSFLKGSQVEKAFNKPNEINALFVMDATPTQLAPCHELLVPLLEEFKDVIHDEISSGLPPLRNIQHCIDLLLGVALPNKVAYRMNLIQQAELQRQVDDLITRG